jgi:hypothetical protein
MQRRLFQILDNLRPASSVGPLSSEIGYFLATALQIALSLPFHRTKWLQEYWVFCICKDKAQRKNVGNA